MNANQAKTQFGSMLINVQSEPVQIVKNGTPVAVVMSKTEYDEIEAMKLEFIRARFENIEEDDLISGEAFFAELDSGKDD